MEGRKVLATHTSVPVAEDMMLTNKISQNLHAELLLRLLGKVHGTDGSFEQGARVVRQFLIGAGVDDNDFFIYDGSGMSPFDRIAPRGLCLAAAVGRGMARYPAGGRRGRHAGATLQELGAEGPPMGQDRHAQRDQRPLRLSEGEQRQDDCIFHHGQRPPSGKRRRASFR